MSISMQFGDKGSIIKHFKNMEDYRVDRTKKYELIEIITIAISAVIAGANDWTDVACWAKANQAWLNKFLKLENGTASHDTFSRIFSRINPKTFLDCFISWTTEISKILKDQEKINVVAIDGKTLRRSFNNSAKKDPIHLISAWSSEFQLTLGQVKVDNKSNEITAIPQLLELLAIEGCIVTIDAIGCQKSIATKVIDKKADYILALKGNQGDLLNDATFLLSEAIKNNKCDTNIEFDKGHGRIEKRTVMVTDKIGLLYQKHEWTKLKSLVRIDSERTINGIKTLATRYFLTSLSADAEKIAYAIRAHWQIESTLHWSLDVTFNEDQSRIRKGHGAQNFALLRRLTFNLIKLDNSNKYSVKTRRFMASFDRNYLKSLLNLGI